MSLDSKLKVTLRRFELTWVKTKDIICVQSKIANLGIDLFPNSVLSMSPKLWQALLKSYKSPCLNTCFFSDTLKQGLLFLQ